MIEETTFVVTVPAEVTSLLTIQELRAAAGVNGSGSDAELTLLGDAVTADIMTECNVAIGEGEEPPTLMRETVVQTFYGWASTRRLALARRHVAAVASVAVDGATVSPSDYVVSAERGILTHVGGRWCGRKIVVEYSAGFTTIPPELRDVASDLVSSRYAWSRRDEFVKKETITVNDIETRSLEFFVGDSSSSTSESGPIPASLAARLKRFCNEETAIG
jgi:hypothetical protein